MFHIRNEIIWEIKCQRHTKDLVIVVVFRDKSNFVRHLKHLLDQNWSMPRLYGIPILEPKLTRLKKFRDEQLDM